MIDIVKYKIFKKYDGDIDNLLKFGSKSDKAKINDEEWSNIDRVLEIFQLLKSNEYSNSIEDNLKTELKQLKTNFSEKVFETLELNK
ncbi:MAG: hypothetical protein RIB79_03705 [Allomuricauda sp.]|jgi:hypothetical protein